MKRCDVCGNAKANFGIGAAMVCRECEPVLREKIKEQPYLLALNFLCFLHDAGAGHTREWDEKDRLDYGIDD